MNESSKLDKFTAGARESLNLAQEEAQRFQHDAIDTGHLLLGLIREGEGVAANALSSLGVELNQVRDGIEFIIGRGNRVAPGEVGLTPRVKTVIELAGDEARRLNHDAIGTEHLLLGLVREGNGLGMAILESLNVRMERVRAETMKILKEQETS